MTPVTGIEAMRTYVRHRQQPEIRWSHSLKSFRYSMCAEETHSNSGRNGFDQGRPKFSVSITAEFLNF